MFWIGFIVILVAALVLTEIIIILVEPFIAMINAKKGKIIVTNQLSETDYTLELVSQSEEKEEEYYNVPILVSSYTVDLSEVKDKIQKIDVDEIEILDFEDEEPSISQSEEDLI